MAHIHKDIDFVVSFFVVFKDKVLLIRHKKLNAWLCPGGHIELQEDPEQALFRELGEETGLTASDVEVLGTKPDFLDGESFKTLYAPAYLDIHHFNKSHRHIGMEYFLRAKKDAVRLAHNEHHDIRWFGLEDLDDPAYAIYPNIKFFAKEAIKRAAA